MKNYIVSIVLLFSIPLHASQVKAGNKAKDAQKSLLKKNKKDSKKNSEKPKTPEKEVHDASIDLENFSPTKIKYQKEVDEYTFPHDESVEGQVAHLKRAPNFELANYVQNNLLSGDAAQKRLDDIATTSISAQEELSNEDVPATTRIKSFSKVLISLSTTFDEIIPKKSWDIYQIKKYSLLADQYNKLLDNPRNAKNELPGMINDFYEISSEIIEAAAHYLKKDKESKNVAKVSNGSTKK
jgi:hypothetical protein